MPGTANDAGAVALPGGRLLADLAYGGAPAQRLDLYLPDGEVRGRGRRWLMLVHGGAWRIGDKAHDGVVAGKVAHWLPQGVALVSVNYRLLPAAGPAEQAADIAAAWQHVVGVLAAPHGLDVAGGSFVAHSSGAHLAALAIARAAAGEPGNPAAAGAVLLDGAALDVPRFLATAGPLLRSAFGPDPAQHARASPLHVLASARAGTPRPALCLVCSSERTDSLAAAGFFAAAWRGIGGRAEVHSLPLSHARLNRGLGFDADSTAVVDAFLGGLGTGRDLAGAAA